MLKGKLIVDNYEINNDGNVDNDNKYDHNRTDDQMGNDTKDNLTQEDDTYSGNTYAHKLKRDNYYVSIVICDTLHCELNSLMAL